jgi:AraC-like DNA-binding protein
VPERPVPVPPPLRPWLAGIAVERLAAPATVLEPPDHATALALRTRPGAVPELVVMGPRTSAFQVPGVPGPACFRLRLRPGVARELLGRPLPALVDRAVPVRELADGLAPGLAELAADAAVLTPGALLDRLGAVLAGRVPNPLVAEAAELLAAGTGVGAVARRLHVGERHLRARFSEGVGVGPKVYGRIDRVRTVLSRAGTRPWRRLAADAGFADQSHMTGEFRRLVGLTLTDYSSRTTLWDQLGRS